MLILLKNTPNFIISAAGSKKTKRSVTENPKESYANASTKYTLEQMSEWLYGVPPLSSNQNFSSTESKSTHVEDDGTEAPTTISGKFSLLKFFYLDFPTDFLYFCL